MARVHGQRLTARSQLDDRCRWMTTRSQLDDRCRWMTARSQLARKTLVSRQCRGEKKSNHPSLSTTQFCRKGRFEKGDWEEVEYLGLQEKRGSNIRLIFKQQTHARLELMHPECKPCTAMLLRLCLRLGGLAKVHDCGWDLPIASHTVSPRVTVRLQCCPIWVTESQTVSEREHPRGIVLCYTHDGFKLAIVGTDGILE
jgi:hypothetical protein